MSLRSQFGSMPLLQDGMMIRSFLIAAGFSLAALAFPAAATTLKFDIVGTYSASFLLDSNPTPSASLDGKWFAIYDYPFPDASGLADIVFFDSFLYGGIQISDLHAGANLVDASGPQLYTGPAGSPTVLTGQYELTGLSIPGTLSLTISAVPEPAAWASMTAGLGLVLLRLRRRGANAPCGDAARTHPVPG